VNMGCAAGVATGVDDGHLHNTVRLSVPATTELGHHDVESSGILRAVRAGCVN